MGSSDPLGVGDALHAQGQFQAALAEHLAALRQRPDSAECHYRVGVDYWHLMQPDASRQHLAEAVRLEPNHAKAHGALAQVLLVRSEPEAAVHHARLAVALAPGDQDLLIGLGSVLESDRQCDAAWEIAEKLLQAGNGTPQFALLLGRMAADRGREVEALAMMTGLLAGERGMPPYEQSALHFGAAALLDGLGQYDQAFEHATRANALRGVKYDPVLVERVTSDFMEYFTRPALRRLPRATPGSETPVFIVGMPRSGTTLVEQILASHPEVHGAGELIWISRLWESAVIRYSNPTAPLSHCLDRLTVNDADALAAQYLTPLRGLRPGAARVTDKMPTNFVHLGLIALLFSRARVIHCRRDPLDTCLSCYLTNFGGGHAFTGSLPSLAHFYRQTERLMTHWKSVLDLSILDVQYEQLVSNFDATTRRMLEFVNLPWDDRCLRFYENRRFNATASRSQVRRPIYRSSVGRWRHYEKQLAPLHAMLSQQVGSG